MHVAVISDLHLGTRGATDIFGHEDNEFLNFLSYLEGNFERIVLLGDIWETLTAPTYFQRVKELRAAQEAHSEIHKRFRGEKYRYVHGNHDLVAGAVEGAAEEFALNVDGVRLLFSHGHQGDGICHERRSVSELAVWAGAWIRRLGLNLLYTYFAHLESDRTSRSGECTVKKWALGQALQRSADVVVTGHTHVSARVEDGSSLFLNSGTCARGNISFLSLDTKRGDYRVNQGY